MKFYNTNVPRGSIKVQILRNKDQMKGHKKKGEALKAL